MVGIDDGGSAAKQNRKVMFDALRYDHSSLIKPVLKSRRFSLKTTRFRDFLDASDNVFVVANGNGEYRLKIVEISILGWIFVELRYRIINLPFILDTSLINCVFFSII